MKGLLTKIKNMNKKVMMIVGGAVAAVVVIVLAVVLILGKSNESVLKNKLDELGTSFYEDFYYEQVGKTEEEKAKFVSNYASTGIKVDLENLARYAGSVKDAKMTSEEIMKMFVNNKTDKECNSKESKVIIYPQGKYGKKDYKLEVKLVCGFKDEAKN